MTAINTHGLKIKGLRKASGATSDWPSRSGGHTQISYDMTTGEILTNDHVGQSWSDYHDSDIITICHTSTHLTMQEIADRIAQRVAEVKAVTLL